MPIIDGTLGADTLTGTAGSDVISGADSGDVLSGGRGDDVIYGFGSADTNARSGSIQVDLLASGFSSPVFGASPPGEPDKLFVPEQHTGRIEVLDLSTATVSSTFLDIPN